MIEGLLKRAKREERTMRAITGVSIHQFDELTIFFERLVAILVCGIHQHNPPEETIKNESVYLKIKL